MTKAERREALRRELEAAVAAMKGEKRGLFGWFHWSYFRRPRFEAAQLDRWPGDAAERPLDFIESAADLALGAPKLVPAVFEPWWLLVRATGAAGRARMRGWRQRDLSVHGHAPLWDASTLRTAREAIEELQAAPRARALAFASCSPSGFVREAALEALAQEPYIEALPFIADRLADWVPPVREAAARALEAKLSPLFVRALLEAWPALDRARRNPRFDAALHSPLVERAGDLLRSQARTGLFLESLDHADPRVRAIAARGALETEGEAVVGRVVERILADRGAALDEETLTALARAVARVADVDERRELECRLVDRPSSSVRRRVVRCLGGAGLLAASELEVADSALQRALLDPSPNVRAAARAASGLERDALEPFYEARTHQGGLAAIAGLADLGVGRHSDVLRAHLYASNSGLRRLAVRTLVRIEGARAKEDLERLLAEPRTCVEAARGLVAIGEPVALDVALALLERADPQATTAAFRLARGLSRLDEGLLCLAALRHSRACARARARLACWLRRTNTGGPLFAGRSAEALRLALRDAPDDPLTVELAARVSTR